MATNRDTFDRIAPAWYGFRHWPLLAEELAEVADRWEAGRLINLGCAHGPDFLPFADRFDLCGVDFSAGMLAQARTYMRKHEFLANLVQSDLTELPFKAGSFDCAVSVAAYHHIEEHPQRQRAFHELYRILRPGAEVFLTVWNHLQPSFRAGPQERLVPWQCGDTVLYRRYHLFTPHELTGYVTEAGFEVLRTGAERRHSGSSESGRNVCVLARRPGL
ncbi:MAG: class I SAM-dependent methyltransferase [Chloroflexota bacterium]